MCDQPQDLSSEVLSKMPAFLKPENVLSMPKFNQQKFNQRVQISLPYTVQKPQDDSKTSIDILLVHDEPLDSTGWANQSIWNQFPDSSRPRDSAISLSSQSNSKDYRLWLAGAILAAHPQARIAIWGQRLETKSIDTGLTASAKALRKAVRKWRIGARLNIEDVSQETDVEPGLRPIIYIAHDMGALVLKEALVQARTDDRVLSKTKGIIFSDAPHRCAKSQLFEIKALHNQHFVQLQEDFEIFRRQRSDLSCCFLVDQHKRSEETSCLWRMVDENADRYTLSEQDPVRIGDNEKRLAPTQNSIETTSNPWTGIVSRLESMYNLPRKDEPSSNLKLAGPLSLLPFKASTLHSLFDIDQDGTGDWGSVDPDWLKYAGFREAYGLHFSGSYRAALAAYRKTVTECTRMISSGASTNTIGQLQSTTMRDIVEFSQIQVVNLLYVLGDFTAAAAAQKSPYLVSERVSENHHMHVQYKCITALLHRIHGEHQSAYAAIVGGMAEFRVIPGSWHHIMALDVFSIILQDRTEFQMAEFILRQVIAALSKKYGPVHRVTLSRLSRLSTLLWLRGNPRRAEEVAYFAFRGLKLKLGLKHPLTLCAARRYADVLRYENRLEDANELLHDVLSYTLEAFGNLHLSTLWIRCSIGAVYILMGYIAEGRALIQAVLLTQKTLSSPNGEDMAWSRRVLRLLDNEVKIRNDPSFDPESLSGALQALLRIPLCAGHGIDEPRSLPTIERYAINLFDDNSLTSYEVSVEDACKGIFGTTICAAAFIGDLKSVRKLWHLEKRSNSAQSTGIFENILYAAIAGGHTEVVRFLLHNDTQSKQTSHTSTSTSSWSYLTSFEVAIFWGHRHIFQELFRDHNPDAFTGSSPLFGSLLYQAVAVGNFEIVQRLFTIHNVLDPPSAWSQSLIDEAGMAAGDTRLLDMSLTDAYVLQQHANIEAKQQDALHIVKLFVDHILEVRDTSTNVAMQDDQSNKAESIIQQAVMFIEYPETSPTSEHIDMQLEGMLKESFD